MPALALLAVLALGGQGCVGIGLTRAAIGPAMASGTGGIVRAGTEYRSNGVLVRTFSVPLADVHEATLAALSKLQVQVTHDTMTPDGGEIVARARDRSISIAFGGLTPVLTQMRLVVSRWFFLRDAATASEILAQTEQRLDEVRRGGK